MDFEILPKLTKRYLLERVSQEDIFEFYLGTKVVLDDLICNPLRVDDTPTCSFYYTNIRGEAKLRFRDFAGYFWGDCFDLVGYLLNVDVNDKVGFNLVLHHIARTFRIHKYREDYAKENEKVQKILNEHKIPKVNKPAVFDYRIRDWNRDDARYWTKYHYNIALLKELYIYPIQIMWINKRIVYEYTTKDPGYAYIFGREANGRILTQAYFPFRTKYKFMINTTGLLGIHLIKKARIGVITKSYKDAGLIKKLAILTGLSFDSVSVSAEGNFVTKSESLLLQGKWTYIITLFDFDFAGIRAAIHHRKTFGYQPLLITNGKRNSKVDYGAKDGTDFVDLYGLEITLDFVKKLYDILLEYLERGEFPSPNKLFRIWNSI